MFNVGDTVQYIGLPPYICTNGWSFKVAKVESGRVFAPGYLGGAQLNYSPAELKLISRAVEGTLVKSESVLWGVRMRPAVGRPAWTVSSRRFYSRKHAQEWARETLKFLGLDKLIRFQTFAR